MPHIELKNNTSSEKLDKILRSGTTFVGAFSNTCPHCINMQSEWKEFISSANKRKIRANILEIDSNVLSSVKNPLINNNIQGFPSLFIIKNNKFVTSYNNERKAAKFLQFLSKYASKSQNKNTKKARLRERKHKYNLTLRNRSPYSF